MMQDTIESHDTFNYLMNRVMYRSPQIVKFFRWELTYGEM